MNVNLGEPYKDGQLLDIGEILQALTVMLKYEQNRVDFLVGEIDEMRDQIQDLCTRHDWSLHEVQDEISRMKWRLNESR